MWAFVDPLLVTHVVPFCGGRYTDLADAIPRPRRIANSLLPRCAGAMTAFARAWIAGLFPSVEGRLMSLKNILSDPELCNEIHERFGIPRAKSRGIGSDIALPANTSTTRTQMEQFLRAYERQQTPALVD